MKTWGELASYDDYSGAVTGVKFGSNASFLVSAIFTYSIFTRVALRRCMLEI